MTLDVTDEGSKARGLFGGFEGHRVPDEDASTAAISSALISLDANVLLGLYRFPDDVGTDLLDALFDLRDRVFVSDQALTEFWRNRTSALADRGRARKEVESRLAASHRAVQEAVSGWAKKVAVDESDLAQTLDLVDQQFELLHAAVADVHSDDVENYPSPSKDPIVARLALLLDGRVGPALDPEAYAAAVDEGTKRHGQGVPPGYKENAKDKAHLKEGVAGDYLVWLQSVQEAERCNLDLLIVTADAKEDWYWRLRETLIGPRQELAKEFWDLTGRQLFMLNPLEFLVRYNAAQGGGVSESVLVEAERHATPPGPDRESAGQAREDSWTPGGVEALLTDLEFAGPVQAAVIRAAAANGGILDRASVYELGSYRPSRMLRGFTRPVSRVTRALQATGDVGLNVPDMLRPLYHSGVQATAFEIPAEVVEILGGTPGRFYAED